MKVEVTPTPSFPSEHASESGWRGPKLCRFQFLKVEGLVAGDEAADFQTMKVATPEDGG
jgi:hypothetical protein